MNEPRRTPSDPPFMRNVGLLMTYHCQAACSHCIIRAGPGRHEEVTIEDARNWISQIASYRNRYVCVLSLTGGEPFSNVKLLKDVMEFAAACKLYISVTTNGAWATSRDYALELLHELPRICFLSISTDLYHQKYIPLETVKNALWAAQKCGIPFYVSLITEDKKDPEYQKVYSDILQLTPTENILTGITFPVGRASQIKSQLQYPLRSDPPKGACQAASSPCIFPDGNVYGCIGPLIDLKQDHPLLLGNLRRSSLQEILDRSETNVLLHALRLWGPDRLISMVKEAGLGRHLPQEYVADSVCTACFEMFSDPAVRNWLSHLEDDIDFRRKVAYGRLYYLQETGMLEFADGGSPLSPAHPVSSDAPLSLPVLQ
jgi:organic radical activating enzyme